MKILYNFIVIVILISSVHAQDFFPLEVGNRWDFSGYSTSMGDPDYHYTTSMFLITNKVKINDLDYFVTSRGIFDKYRELGNDSLFLRAQNDSLFCFNYLDSTDCLLFAFDKLRNLSQEKYNSCMYDSIMVGTDNGLGGPIPIFGQPDSQQVHTFLGGNRFVFSKKYGLIDFEYGNLSRSFLGLSGCVISGITYGVLLGVKDEISNEKISYKLRQNYPNPFNPTTTISYSIPKKEFVILKIFDGLGKEVAILEQRLKNGGNYTIKFDASKLTSGIYFYRLTTSQFTETKKMLLLK